MDDDAADGHRVDTGEKADRDVDTGNHDHPRIGHGTGPLVRPDPGDRHRPGRRQGRQPGRADRCRAPPGFVVTAEAYRYALEAAGVDEQLAALVAGAHPDDPADLERAATAAQELIRTVTMPPDLSAAVLEAYHRLGDGTRVAVRSSGTAEDGAET